MEKLCDECQKTKPLNLFYKRSGTSIVMGTCKECRKKRKDNNRRSDFYTLYYLPEEHYIGITCRLKQRMYQHRSRSNRITDGYEILGTFERAVDARYVEAMFHIRGYNGFNLK